MLIKRAALAATTDLGTVNGCQAASREASANEKSASYRQQKHFLRGLDDALEWGRCLGKWKYAPNQDDGSVRKRRGCAGGFFLQQGSTAS